MSKLRIGILTFFIFLIFPLAILFFKAVKTISVINSTEESSLFTPEEDERWDILILGMRGKNAPFGGILTDSITILSYQSLTKKLAIFSIPRDLWIEVPKKRWMKINQVYETGIIENPKGGGISLAKKVISKISGLDIDFTIIIDVEGLRKIVDILGGIEVEEQRSFSADFYGHFVQIYPGKNHLNGGEVLAYIGSRKIEGADFGRMKRQQKVILAIKDKIFSSEILFKPDKIWKILSEIERHLETDLPPSKILEFSKAVPSIEISQTKTIVFDTSNYLYHPPTDTRGYILLPKKRDYSQIQEVFQNVFETF